MVIEKGREWGESIERPDELRVAGSDAELAALLGADRRAPITVRDGDIYRSLGSPRVRNPVQRLPMDLLHVTVDDRRLDAVAHVVARRSWWFGGLAGAFNVGGYGGWNAAPRAHPNDGRLDVIEVDSAMTLRERWQARSRLASGMHVPHPRIAQRRATSVDWDFSRPVDVSVDAGEPIRATRVSLTVEPDAYLLYI